MISNFEIVIGIEIHIELNTKTKAFSGVENNFNSPNNTLISPIDLGYPGSLPLLNKEVVIKAIQLAKALNMEIDEELHFDRKNYYYTDLPKGFQITQQFRPIGKNGFIELNLESYKKKIRIERIHIEEDTARQIHNEKETLINYNRAGIPLIEIVSYADIRTKEEAAEYVNSIRQIASFLDISDAKMAEGSLRADINISTRLVGSNKFGKKVEIKNLNSLNNIKKAIDFEANLQISKIMNNKSILQETKRFDEQTNQTVSMRDKTDAIDYRYFPEPNIPVIHLGKKMIDSIQINELPNQMRKRYESYGVSDEYIEQIINNKEYANFLDHINYENKLDIVKIFFAEIVPLEKKINLPLQKLNIDPQNVLTLINMLNDGFISGKQLKTIVPKLINLNEDIQELIKRLGIQLISDQNVLNQWIDEVNHSNPNLKKVYEEKPENTMKFIVGEVMKKSKGQANPVLTVKLVQEKFGVKGEEK